MYNYSNSQIVGQNVIHLDEIDSTNDYATKLISKTNPIEGTVVSAAYQSAGKGQYGRKWHSEATENITLSVILYPHFLKITDQFLLSIMTSLAVCDVVNQFTKRESTVKWPNDVYVKNDKLAGILIQNFLQGRKINSSIVGIGMNVNQSTFSKDVPNPTSLKLLAKKEQKLEEVKIALYDALNMRYHEIRNKKTAIRKEYLSKLFGMNTERLFKIDDKTQKGVVRNVDPMGRLLVEINGIVRSFNHGEIQFVITI